MKESKKTIRVTIIVILLILLVTGIFIVPNKMTKNSEVNPNFTNQMVNNLETNIINEDKTIDNKVSISEENISNNVEISNEEKIKIEQYIDILCNRPNCCRLPEFDSLANADKDWIYLHIDREKYEQYATEQEVLENLQEVFGDKLKINIKNDQKNIPTDRFSGIPWAADEEGKCLLPIWGDALIFLYTINDIKKENDQYTVNVIEYCDDIVDENPYERAVFSFKENEENKLVFRLDNEQDAKDNKVIEKVLQNKDKFSTFDVILKNENNKLIVESIKKNKI